MHVNKNIGEIIVRLEKYVCIWYVIALIMNIRLLLIVKVYNVLIIIAYSFNIVLY